MAFDLVKPDVDKLVVLGKKIRVLLDHLKTSLKLTAMRTMPDDSFMMYEASQTSERTKKF